MARLYLIETDDGRTFTADTQEEADQILVDLADSMSEGMGSDGWEEAHSSIEVTETKPEET